MVTAGTSEKEKPGSAVWVVELGDALTLLEKSQTALKSLESKLADDAKMPKPDLHQKDKDDLNSKIETLQKEKKELESKNQKLINEVSSLKEKEEKQNEIRKLNKELQKQLEVKKSEYEVSINEHARTKLANEDIRQKNNELYEEISDLKKELEKYRGVQSPRSPSRRDRPRSGDSRGRVRSRSGASIRGNRSRNRSVRSMKRSRSGSVLRKRSLTRSHSRSLRRSMSRRKRSPRSCSFRNNRSRLRESVNRSLTPRLRRGAEQDRSRSRSRSTIRRDNSVDSYAELKRRRRLSSGRRDASFRRSTRR